jgi:hypothetical protein
MIVSLKPALQFSGVHGQFSIQDIQSLPHELCNFPRFILKFEDTEKVRIVCIELLVSALRKRTASTNPVLIHASPSSAHLATATPTEVLGVKFITFHDFKTFEY